MAGGWTRDGAIQTQIDDTVSDAIANARRRLVSGETVRDCVDCGEEIPEPRRQAMPGVTRCISEPTCEPAMPVHIRISFAATMRNCMPRLPKPKA